MKYIAPLTALVICLAITLVSAVWAIRHRQKVQLKDDVIQAMDDLNL